MAKLRIFIAGKSGQLAQALMACPPSAEIELCLAGRPDFDLASPEALATPITAFAPDVILNAAAYTNVDKAESEPTKAHAINAAGAEALAKISHDLSIPIIQISTDCVFDGAKPTPYAEGDTPSPINRYGESKLAGEIAVAAANPKHLIVRVSWVFSHYGGNFVRTMLDLAEARDEVTVVNDQIGNPTHATDLAAGLIAMVKHCTSDPNFSDWGVYHLAGAGETSRADMAKAIFADSHKLGGKSAHVIPVPTTDYKTAATRPLNARLSAARAKQVFDVELPHWRMRLTDCVRALIVERQRA